MKLLSYKEDIKNLFYDKKKQKKFLSKAVIKKD